MITISEHTIDETLLTGGIVIDAGCRGFGFSEGLRDLGCKVYAFDLEEMIPPEGIHFKRAALTDRDGIVHYKEHNDKQATHLTDDGIPIEAININTLYDQLGEIDVLKLDIEGSEYAILASKNFRPVPRQISVEFHEHCHGRMHRKYFDACLENLLEYYTAVKLDRYPAHGCVANYWDCLLLKKGL